MDIFTQGILGAAASQAVFARKLPRSAWLIGLVAGLLADADVLIRPASDPLGGLTYHRHFSHSLLFIPIGALIAAIPFLLYWAIRRGATGRLGDPCGPQRADAETRVSEPTRGTRANPTRGTRDTLTPATAMTIYLCSLVAYSTHALLDCCTSYGTMLFWPFSDVRISWDLIAIIDPLFTVPLLIGVIIAVWRQRPTPAITALAISISYMFVGLVQRDRVFDAQRELAAMRGHTIERGRVIPAPLSLLLWRSVYITTDGQIVADAVRTPYFANSTVLTGSSTPRITADDIRKAHPRDPQLVAAFEQFSWFADGYTAVHATEPLVIGDMRYCLEGQTFDSLWGFFMGDPAELGDGPLGPRREPPPGAVPQRMVSFRMSRGERYSRVWKAIIGEDTSFQTLATVRARGG